MTFFRQFLHAKANFSDRHYASMSSKNSNLHAKKMLKIGRLLFLNLSDCSNFCNSMFNLQKYGTDRNDSKEQPANFEQLLHSSLNF